jgi:hypothetical protein
MLHALLDAIRLLESDPNLCIDVIQATTSMEEEPTQYRAPCS